MSAQKSVHYAQYTMFWVYQQPNFNFKQAAKIIQNLEKSPSSHTSSTYLHVCSAGKWRGHLEAPSGAFGRQPKFIAL